MSLQIAACPYLDLVNRGVLRAGLSAVLSSPENVLGVEGFPRLHPAGVLKGQRNPQKVLLVIEVQRRRPKYGGTVVLHRDGDREP